MQNHVLEWGETKDELALKGTIVFERETSHGNNSRGFYIRILLRQKQKKH